MTAPESQPAAPLPRPPFQFRLRTLLLLCVVLGSSLAVFGVGGILVFILVLLLATDRRRVVSPVQLFRLLVALLCLGCLGGLFMPGVDRHFSDARSRCAMPQQLEVNRLGITQLRKSESLLSSGVLIG